MTFLRLDQMVVPGRLKNPTPADFENAIGTQTTPAILSALIPAGTPNSYGAGARTEYGFKYEWVGHDGEEYKVWGHSAVQGAPADTFASKEWTFRVQRGAPPKFLTSIKFATGQGGSGPSTRWWSGKYADRTHILLEP